MFKMTQQILNFKFIINHHKIMVKKVREIRILADWLYPAIIKPLTSFRNDIRKNLIDI